MSGDGDRGGNQGTQLTTYSTALQSLTSARKLPSLIVFSLDKTIWPFKLAESGDTPPGNPYPDVDGIFSALKFKHIKMAVVSQNDKKLGTFLFHFAWQGLFTILDVPLEEKVSSKLGDLRKSTGVVFEEMLYFDGDRVSAREVARMGATAVFVENGLTVGDLTKGLSKFEQTDLDNRGF